MKKTISIILCLTMLFVITACGNEGASDEPKNDSAPTSAADNNRPTTNEIEINVPEVSEEETPETETVIADSKTEVASVEATAAETDTKEEPETSVTMYAPDGRTTVVADSEVSAYQKVGWYKTREEAQAVNVKTSSDNSGSNYDNQPNSGGRSVYKTPTGKRYHFDPDCGGKNSSETTLQKAKNAGLTPCKKCAQ